MHAIAMIGCPVSLLFYLGANALNGDTVTIIPPSHTWCWTLKIRKDSRTLTRRETELDQERLWKAARRALWMFTTN
jgi:hypothetical protein